jgi:hypothetical protein
MTIALPNQPAQPPSRLPLCHPNPITVTWEPLPPDFKLEEKPVDNTGQPLIAAALRESLELAQLIQPQVLIAANFGLCATLNDTLVIKAPDWVYVPTVLNPEPAKTRKSYTPNLEGEVPSLVIEFLSDEDGEEYSVRRYPPVGRWFFYEQILKVPTYVVFEPEGGLLEVYRLREGRYELELPDPDGRHWMETLGLFLGTWRGLKSDRQGYWLRWWDAQGQMLPWGTEKVEQAQQQAEQERQRADRLAEYLRAQGINPDDLPT